MTGDDLLAQTAAFSLALLLTGSLFAHPCFAAPTDRRLDTRPWHHPCGTNKQDTGAPPPLVRHPAMKAVKRVRAQIRIASDHYAKEKGNIDMLYQELKKEFKDVINYDWLPTKQLEWYESDARCLAKSKRLALVLPALHISLQKYLITLEEVNRFPASIHEPHDVAKIRKRILFEISKELKKWLCEVETALMSSSIQIPSRTSDEIIPRHDLNRWHSDPDHTSSLIQAWGVLNAYHKFVQDWQKIFKTALEIKIPPGCKRTSKKSKKTPDSATPRRKKPKQPTSKNTPLQTKPTLKRKKPAAAATATATAVQ